MLEKLSIPNILSKIPEKLAGLKKAISEFAGSDKSMLERLSILGKSILQELGILDKEEDAVKDETKKKTDEAVAEALKPAKESVKLDTSKVDKPEQEFYEEILAVGDVNLRQVTQKHSEGVVSGLEKISGAVKDGKEGSFNYDEIASMGATVAGTVAQLKDDPRYNTPEKFEAMLDRLDKVSDNTDYPLSKLRSFETVGLFRLTDEDDAVKLLGKFDLKPSTGDVVSSLAGKIGLETDGGVLTEMKTTFAGLKEDPIKNLEGMIKIVKENFLKTSSTENISSLLRMANKIILGNHKELTNKQLTQMVFLVENADLKNFVTVLTG